MRPRIYEEKIITLLEKHHLLGCGDIAQLLTIDQSTVFRNLEHLIEEKKVQKVVFDKNIVRYELMHADHKHGHFMCNDCGDIESIDIPQNIASRCGAVSDLLIKGTCHDCAC